MQKELTKKRREEAVTLYPNEKRKQKRLEEQQERDEVYDLTDLLESQTRYTDNILQVNKIVVNKITSLLDESLVVDVSGKIVKSDGYTIEEYNTILYTRAQFESYLNKLQDTRDIEEWKF